jgi:hypothetical protein
MAKLYPKCFVFCLGCSAGVWLFIWCRNGKNSDTIRSGARHLGDEMPFCVFGASVLR